MLTSEELTSYNAPGKSNLRFERDNVSTHEHDVSLSV